MISMKQDDKVAIIRLPSGSKLKLILPRELDIYY